MVTATNEIEIGDRVEIDWGPGPMEGEVLVVYGPVGNRHLVVEVPFHDAFGEVVATSTASVRLGEVKRKI